MSLNYVVPYVYSVYLAIWFASQIISIYDLLKVCKECLLVAKVVEYVDSSDLQAL